MFRTDKPQIPSVPPYLHKLAAAEAQLEVDLATAQPEKVRLQRHDVMGQHEGHAGVRQCHRRHGVVRVPRQPSTHVLRR